MAHDAPVPRPVSTRHLWIWSALVSGTLLLLVALVVGAWLWRERERAIHDGERSARAYVRLLEEQTARSFEAVDLTLAGIIDGLRLNPGLGEHDAGFEGAMRQRLKSLPHVRALFAIGPDGFITQDTDHPRTPRVPLNDRDYFQEHAKDPSLAMRIGQPLISRSVGRWFASATRRIDRPDGSFGGVAVAAIEPLYFERFYRELELGRNGSIGLYLRDGPLIARFPYREELMGRDFSNLELFRDRLTAAPQGVYRIPSAFDGKPRIIGYQSVENLSLVVAVSLDEGELLAAWRRSAVATCAAFAAVVALTLLLVTVWVQRRVERDHTLQQMIQHQNLEALGRMTGGITHDFNNLMAVVASGLRTIRRRSDDQDLRQVAATIEDAVKRGRKLTRQLLAFARRQELEVTQADVNALIGHIEALLRNAAGPGIDLSIDLASDVPHCLTDETQFDTALLNLVVNARDAMPSGGAIRISTTRCADDDVRRTAALKPGVYACVTVSDTGQGMPPSVARRALEPFFSTKGDKGTGLGLSQVYGFIRQIGGDIRIESSVGRGTSVHLFFPAHQAGAATPG